MRSAPHLHTDRGAEVENTLRRGMPVELESFEASTSTGTPCQPDGDTADATVPRADAGGVP
ncbi:MAG: hypothetical protein ABI920_10815 [Casimicrobiaceae bacterium]